MNMSKVLPYILRCTYNLRNNVFFSSGKSLKIRVTSIFIQNNTRDFHDHDERNYRPFSKFHNAKTIFIVIGGGLILSSVFQNNEVAFCEAKSKFENDGEHGIKQYYQEDQISVREAICKSEELLGRIKDEVGTPGLVVAVSINGQEVWNTGLGYADVENRVPCTEDTVMRIASVSKPIAMATVAKLWEEQKLDIDEPITKYVKDWPAKNFGNEKVEITIRQLVSHLGGVRHYDKNCGKKENNEVKTKAADEKNPEGPQSKHKNKKGEQTEVITSHSPSEFEKEEYYVKEKFHSVSDALKMFKDDNLCSKPGSEFLYTTHGYTLISAVVEGASGKKFPAMCQQLFRELGMSHTYLDENEPIIYNRSRYYIKDKNGRLKNAPYVDCSYKWAGGGMISTAGDLVKFANTMLYSSQYTHNNPDVPAGYLKASTMRTLWSPVPKTKCSWDKDGGSYGMGWAVMPKISKYGHGKRRDFYVSHTGGAIGASSVLLILPKSGCLDDGVEDNKPEKLPQGIAVAIMVNMQGVNLNPVALEIAKIFRKVKFE